jgi:hypothetical protein
MKNAIYHIYDAMTMLISPTLERTFDRLEAWGARWRRRHTPRRYPQNLKQLRTVMANKS